MNKIIVAHITIEAKTPLKVGSSDMDFFKDSPIQRDWNNLPMILGTSIAGILRSYFDEEKAKELFGYQTDNIDEGEGSKIIVSNALLLDENKKVHEELLLKKSNFLKNFENLPVREHTAINERGVTKEHSKFDEEIVFKGSRFKFAIEFLNVDEYKEILDILKDETFRIGSGATKGFGEIEIIEITYEEFNDKSYIDFENSLNYKLTKQYKALSSKEVTKYTLKIKPDNVFMFGSGFGDKEADMIPIYEKIIDYENKTLNENKILIPASSIKGAIAHRVAYYYNLDKNIFADKVDNIENFIGENNKAVVEIFGHKKEEKGNKELGKKGKVLISDCFYNKTKEKIFDHIAIDRFTGGGIEGALFQEKTVFDEDEEYEINFILREDLSAYEKYFLKALKDIAQGKLPLGGATTKGHGFFKGKIYKNGEEI